MKKEYETHYRFKQPNEQGKTRCSVIHNGEYIFSPTEARKYRPELVEEYTLKKVRYTDEEDFNEALKEMPDYECWDSNRRVLIKEIK